MGILLLLLVRLGGFGIGFIHEHTDTKSELESYRPELKSLDDIFFQFKLRTYIMFG
jgi:hypothetical protein